jgi:hypothetical protein
MEISVSFWKRRSCAAMMIIAAQIRRLQKNFSEIQKLDSAKRFCSNENIFDSTLVCGSKLQRRRTYLPRRSSYNSSQRMAV